MVVKTAISEEALRHFVGEIVAVDVSLEDYMAKYADQHCEWIEGVVINVAGATIRHVQVIMYLTHLLGAYFDLRPIGQLLIQPFVMRLPAFPRRRREPDMILILKSNPHELRNTFMDGPADIVIEVVSEESTERDHGEKFREYEQGGVPEYWIIDGLREESRFYRLDENGRYQRHTEDEGGNYTTPTLPGLLIHVPTLWLPDLPGPTVIVPAVIKMLEAK